MNQLKNRRLGPLMMIIGLAAVVVVACGDTTMIGDAMVEAGTALRDASSDAAAQDEATCRQWSVAAWHPFDDCDGGPSVSEGGCSVPAGWTPITMNPQSTLNNYVMLRRCIGP